MNEEKSLETAAAKLQEFQNARAELESSLSQVEALIEQLETMRDSIQAALSSVGGESGAPKAPAKKATAKKTAKKKPAGSAGEETVKPDSVNEDDHVEEIEEDNIGKSVVEHLPAGETQDEVIEAGEDLDDWEPGVDTEETDSSLAAKKDQKSFGAAADDFNFDEIKF